MEINRECLGTFKTNGKLLFQMSAQVYSVPGQTERRSKSFLEWENIDLSHESHTCGDNVNYYKSVHQPIPTGENREHPGNFQNKSVSSAFKRVLPSYFLK